MIADLLEKLLRWGMNRIGLRTVIGIGLIWLALGSLVVGLSGVIQMIPLAQGLLVCLIGTVLAWSAARSRLTNLQSGIGLVLIGCLGLTLLAGGLWSPMARFTRSLFLWIQQGDLKPAQTAFVELRTGSVALAARLWSWFAHISSTDQPFDPLVVWLVWSVNLWLISIWAAWCTRRWGQPLLAVAPAGAVLAGITNYTSANALVLIPFLGAAFLLMALASHAQREAGWQAGRIDFSEDIRSDLGIWAFAVTGVIVLFAASVPSISIHQLTGWVRQVFPQEASPVEPLARSLGVKQLRSGDEPWGTVATGSLPRSFLLGAGPELTKRVVMRIRTDEVKTSPPITTTASPPMYYWRAASLDNYTGFGWATTPTVRETYSPGKSSIISSRPASQSVRQDVEILDSLSNGVTPLYTAGDLITADQTYSIDWRQKPGESAEADYFGAWLKTNRYQAESRVSTASITDLRGASQEYPEWIRSHYLQLPDAIHERVRQLARDLTAGQSTPYDQAKAIESYLRQFPYTLDVPAPPTGAEVTEYFLFELKRGYCDYYATSMVVLARTVGIPARIAIGYAPGTYDPEQAAYVIRGVDAHSWPEIYFPGYGWIGFEPTASLPEIDRPLLTISSPSETTHPPVRQKTGWSGATGVQIILLAMSAILLLILVGIIIWLAADCLRFQKLNPGAAIEIIYTRLMEGSQSISRQRQPGDTPFEMAQRLGSDLRAIQGRGRWGKALRGADRAAFDLSETYAVSAFSPRPAGQSQKGRAIQSWSRLRWQLQLARLVLWLTEHTHR